MRARPKVLLARNYEEAMARFDEYQEAIIAVIPSLITSVAMRSRFR